jgi:hypothetical protein
MRENNALPVDNEREGKAFRCSMSWAVEKSNYLNSSFSLKNGNSRVSILCRIKLP